MKNRAATAIAMCGALFLAGCWAAAAGVGAEAGYIAAQDDRTAGETLDDQRITSTIKTKFAADSDVSALNINVDTFKKNVTLSGSARSQREMDKAAEIAKSVSDVRSVRTKLAVR